MIWVMAELVSKKPHLIKKVQNGIRATVSNKQRVEPDDWPSSNTPRWWTGGGVNTWLQPALPLQVPRETLQHVKISGHDVPANTRLFVNVWAINPASWENLVYCS